MHTTKSLVLVLALMLAAACSSKDEGGSTATGQDAAGSQDTVSDSSATDSGGGEDAGSSGTDGGSSDSGSSATDGGSGTKDAGSSSGGKVKNSYAGPGSDWVLEVKDDNKVTMMEKDSKLTIEATATLKPSGFYELVADSVQGSGVSKGDKAYGIEVPGVTYLLKPFKSDQLIPMVQHGKCPTADYTANWVAVNLGDDDKPGEAGVFGTYKYTHANTSSALPTQYNFKGDSAGKSMPLGTHQCKDGLAVIKDSAAGGSIGLYLTANGGAAINTNIDDDAKAWHVIALPAQKLDAASVKALTGDFVGLVFANDVLLPVNAKSDGSGEVDVATVNPDTGKPEAIDGVEIDSTIEFGDLNVPDDGFTVGSIDGSDTDLLACMINTNASGSGKSIIFCTGVMVDEKTKEAELFNMLLVTK
ncbi:MAG: hypothetical protein KC502_18340 [Myxococcales bacterium]|nr:hypothetical protein [Myxococcales bacterium]